MLALIMSKEELLDQRQRLYYSCLPSRGWHVDSADSRIFKKPVHCPTVYTMNLFKQEVTGQLLPQNSCMSFPQAQVDWNWTQHTPQV